MKRGLLLVPLVLFAAIIALGYAGFRLADPHQLPSALLDKAFPEFSLASLDGHASTRSRSDLLGQPVLVNVWATWCPTCRAEHDVLMRLRTEHGLRIVGVVYRDTEAKARRWLQDYGDPYAFTVLDPAGELAVDLGVYGAPESFLVDAQGTIVYKRVGAVDMRIWNDEIAPVLAQITPDA